MLGDLTDAGAEFVREIAPGEMVVIEHGKVVSSQPFAPAKGRFCIFEHVYFSRPDSIVFGSSVNKSRHRMGKQLARECPADADIVNAAIDLV